MSPRLSSGRTENLLLDRDVLPGLIGLTPRNELLERFETRDRGPARFSHQSIREVCDAFLELLAGCSRIDCHCFDSGAVPPFYIEFKKDYLDSLKDKKFAEAMDKADVKCLVAIRASRRRIATSSAR